MDKRNLPDWALEALARAEVWQEGVQASDDVLRFGHALAVAVRALKYYAEIDAATSDFLAGASARSSHAADALAEIRGEIEGAHDE